MLKIVVGYRMVMFQITERKSLNDAAYAPEQFDTFFKEIGQKLRGCLPKNDFGWGVVDPTHFHQTCISLLLHKLFQLFWCLNIYVN